MLLPSLALLFILLWSLDCWLQPSLYIDGVAYAVAARELAAGRSAALFDLNRPPLFPMLIALVSWLTSLEVSVALRIVVLLSGLAAILLTYRLLYELTADAGAARLATAMAVVGIPAICGLRFAVLSDSLGLCLVIGAIMASAAASTRRSTALAAGAGLIWGLAALARTQYLPLGPPALVLFFYLSRQQAQDARQAQKYPAKKEGGPGQSQPSADHRQLYTGIAVGRGLAFLCGWLFPVVVYYALLSLHQRGLTVPNAYDVPYVLTPSMARMHRVLHAFVSPLVTGLPLLLSAGLLFLWSPRPRLSSLGSAVNGIVLWILMAGVLSSIVAVAARTERRYFLVAHWCVWVLAGLAYAARRARTGRSGLDQTVPVGPRATEPHLERWVIACLTLAMASYPIYALQRHDEWPMPTAAYAAAGRWVNATFGPSPRVAVTGDRMTILYEVHTPAVLSVQDALSRDWSTLEQWLRTERPDVLLIGPDPGAARRPVSPVYQALLTNPRSGQQVGLAHVRSFAAPEGTVHALLPADQGLTLPSPVKTSRGSMLPK
jgi:hypothetical protein